MEQAGSWGIRSGKGDAREASRAGGDSAGFRDDAIPILVQPRVIAPVSHILGRLDVLVHPEEITRVIFIFDDRQP